MVPEKYSPEALGLSHENLVEFVDGVFSQKPVSGLTHKFYRYPARFSPYFARACIKGSSQGIVAVNLVLSVDLAKELLLRLLPS